MFCYVIKRLNYAMKSENKVKISKNISNRFMYDQGPYWYFEVICFYKVGVKNA